MHMQESELKAAVGSLLPSNIFRLHKALGLTDPQLIDFFEVAQ